MDYIYVNDKEALEALMKRNLEDTNGNIIRKFEVNDLDMIDSIIDNCRANLPLGIKHHENIYLIEEDSEGEIFVRMTKKLTDNSGGCDCHISCSRVNLNKNTTDKK